MDTVTLSGAALRYRLFEICVPHLGQAALGIARAAADWIEAGSSIRDNTHCSDAAPAIREASVWTAERLVELERWCAAGKRFAEIAEHFGVPAAAVSRMVRRSGIAGRWPRSTRKLLFEPYPLDAPWPPPEQVADQPAAAEQEGGWPSEADRSHLRELVASENSFVALAVKLGAPDWLAVRDAAAEMGLLAKTAEGNWTLPGNAAAVGVPGRKPKKRPCLRCHRDFLSEGAHHRMCDSCRHSAADIYDPEPARA